jgi:hypothetical protein
MAQQPEGWDLVCSSSLDLLGRDLALNGRNRITDHFDDGQKLVKAESQ